MTSVPFFLAFFVIVISFALSRGGGPEKAGAATYVIALAASASIGVVHMPGGFQAVPLTLFLADVLLLIALMILAIGANRWWPIPAAGCQLVAVLVHTAKLLDPAMIPNGYAFLVTIWSWPMVALLGLGTWSHRRRLSQDIIGPDWKPFSALRLSPIRRNPPQS